jgi:hypothetical protein
MYVNAKILLVETIPVMGGGRRVGKGLNPSMMYLIHFKKFWKCHNVPQPSKTIKKEERKILF